MRSRSRARRPRAPSAPHSGCWRTRSPPSPTRSAYPRRRRGGGDWPSSRPARSRSRSGSGRCGSRRDCPRPGRPNSATPRSGSRPASPRPPRARVCAWPRRAIATPSGQPCVPPRTSPPMKPVPARGSRPQSSCASGSVRRSGSPTARHRCSRARSRSACVQATATPSGARSVRRGRVTTVNARSAARWRSTRSRSGSNSAMHRSGARRGWGWHGAGSS